MRATAILHESPRRFVVNNMHEQIQLAAVRVVAKKGYSAVSVRDVCAEAHISAKMFNEHFSSKQEVVLTAVEAALDQVMGYCQEAFQAAPTWEDGIWDTLEIGAEWAEQEPAFATATVVQMLTIGPDARELLHSLMDAFALFLQPGYRLLESPAQRTLDETISGRVFELLYTHLTRNPPETLSRLIPEVARTALTPFLGPQATEAFIARREADC
ncbi:MAG: helix-turn-helix domain-containing protein [Solirubrobacteraceae bacterium]